VCAGEGRLEKEGVRPLRGGVGAVAHPHVGSIGAGQEQGRGKQWIVGAMHYSQVGSIGAGQEQGRGKQWSAGAMHYLHVGSIGSGQEQGRGKQWSVGAMHYPHVGSIGAGQEQCRGKQWNAGAMHYPHVGSIGAGQEQGRGKQWRAGAMHCARCCAKVCMSLTLAYCMWIVCLTERWAVDYGCHAVISVVPRCVCFDSGSSVCSPGRSRMAERVGGFGIG